MRKILAALIWAVTPKRAAATMFAAAALGAGIAPAVQSVTAAAPAVVAAAPAASPEMHYGAAPDMHYG